MKLKDAIRQIEREDGGGRKCILLDAKRMKHNVLVVMTEHTHSLAIHDTALLTATTTRLTTFVGENMTTGQIIHTKSERKT